jgi:hypothetical protein
MRNNLNVQQRLKTKASRTQRVTRRSFEGSNRPLGYGLPTSLSVELPNCAQSPIDALSHSTTDDSHSNNAPVRHSNLAAGHRLRGCAHLCRGSLCPVLLLPFRLHVGTYLCYRLARGVLPQITKAPQSLRLPLLFFQIVDSRVSPLCFSVFDGRNPDFIKKN